FARTRYGATLDIQRFEKAVELAQVRATTLVQIADQMAFLFTSDEELEIDPVSWEKLVKVEQAGAILDAVTDYVENVDWSDEIDIRPAIDALGLNSRKAMPVVYTAIEGRSSGLPIFSAISMLGRDPSLRRLRAARARL